MRKLFVISFLFFCAQVTAQIKSVNIYTDYSTALNKIIGVNKADAVGGGAKVKFILSENFCFGFTGGYKLYSIAQPNDINNWGWIFWTERYYSKIISDLAADPNLSVVITSVQKMDLIPFSFFVEYELPVAENLIFSPSAEWGIYFYTKRLYAIETWSKYFPAENYSFTYSYRNFAPRKYGSPMFAKLNLDLEYRIGETIGISGSIGYSHPLLSSKASENNFPLKSELSLGLGLTIIY